jgi:trafficking protein particle complex subunit 12
MYRTNHSPLVGSDTAAPPQRSDNQPPTSRSNSGRLSSNALYRFDDLQTELDSILAMQKLPTSTKDLSFLLRPEMFHPISQLDVPSAFRSAFYNPPPGEPLTESLGILNKMLAEGQFLLAAHLCGTLLTSDKLSPTDDRTIFNLVYSRLACLELAGNTAFAAQESKALEDLSSAFYYDDCEIETGGQVTDRAAAARSCHIVPWPLRVLAVRLQSIGFGDSRRSVAGLYELGLEARREVSREGITPMEKEIWRSRLADLGIRSVNALIEMGDLDAARRSLDNLELKSHNISQMRINKALLYLRLGDVMTASEIINQTDSLGDGSLRPLLSMAEGRYEEAIEGWKGLLELNSDNASAPLICQNLAVCLLYTGQLNEVRYRLSERVLEDQL